MKNIVWYCSVCSSIISFMLAKRGCMTLVDLRRERSNIWTDVFSKSKSWWLLILVKHQICFTVSISVFIKRNMRCRDTPWNYCAFQTITPSSLSSRSLLMTFIYLFISLFFLHGLSYLVPSSFFNYSGQDFWYCLNSWQSWNLCNWK